MLLFVGILLVLGGLWWFGSKILEFLVKYTILAIGAFIIIFWMVVAFIIDAVWRAFHGG